MKTTAPSAYEQLLADDVVLAYIEWREECGAVRECERRWDRTAAPGDAVRAQAAYQAALDREEAAARVYAKRLERLGGRRRVEEP